MLLLLLLLGVVEVVAVCPAPLALLLWPLLGLASMTSSGTSHTWSMLLTPSLLLPQDSLTMAAYLSRTDRVSASISRSWLSKVDRGGASSRCFAPWMLGRGR
jgi:hypothetical protein